MIVVCPAVHAPDLCREIRPSHVLGLMAPGDPLPYPSMVSHRLVFTFNDIVAPRHGLVMPGETDIAEILAFGCSWTGECPLLVHCALGISRSTAASFILACAAEPDRPETEIAHALRAAAPCATPNALMVSLADRQLGRGGRMAAAVAAIGRGADYAPYRAFMLDVRIDALSSCRDGNLQAVG